MALTDPLNACNVKPARKDRHYLVVVSCRSHWPTIDYSKLGSLSRLLIDQPARVECGLDQREL